MEYRGSRLQHFHAAIPQSSHGGEQMGPSTLRYLPMHAGAAQLKSVVEESERELGGMSTLQALDCECVFLHPHNLGCRGIHFLWRLRQHTASVGLAPLG